MRVGILGCGQVSADHLVGWRRCNGATLVAACDPDLARAKARASEFGIPKAFASPAEMLEKLRPDLVDVITPRETHADMVRLAARYGARGVLCEKPLCPTLAEAQALVREMANVTRLMVNENWRYRDYYRQIGGWIRDGRLGTIVHYHQALIRANMLPDAQGIIPALARQPFMARERRLLIAESLIHELDVARSLLGDLAVVAARIGNACDAVIGEDSAVIFLETPSGLPAVVEGALTAAGHHIRAGDRLQIGGTRCSLLLENATLRLSGAEQEEHRYDETQQRQACFDASIQHFVDCMQSGEPFWTSAQDQLGTLKIVEDAYALAGQLRKR
jgi:predicted dehydrogenase